MMIMLISLEKINLKKMYSVVKIIGMVIIVVGVMVMILYKGLIVDFIKLGGVVYYGIIIEFVDKYWVIGIMMFLVSILSWLSYFIL